MNVFMKNNKVLQFSTFYATKKDNRCEFKQKGHIILSKVETWSAINLLQAHRMKIANQASEYSNVIFNVNISNDQREYIYCVYYVCMCDSVVPCHSVRKGLSVAQGSHVGRLRGSRLLVSHRRIWIFCFPKAW